MAEGGRLPFTSVGQSVIGREATGSRSCFDGSGTVRVSVDGCAEGGHPCPLSFDQVLRCLAEAPFFGTQADAPVHHFRHILPPRVSN